MSTTANMNLVLPEVSVTFGPVWASILNTALGVIDLHDHSSGNGVQITPSGLDINADLDLQSNDLLSALSLALVSQDAAVTSKTGSLQRVGANLYWINAAGVAVQITSGSSVVSTGSGVFSVYVPGSYPYTVTTGNAQNVILVDTSSARTLTLPAATNAMHFCVKDSVGSGGANAISIAPDGTDTIEGVNATYTMNSNFQALNFISDGVSAWYVV